MENGEAKEVTCMTHGYELWGNGGGRRGAGQKRIKGRKIWDNCNRIINKIYLINNKRKMEGVLLMTINHIILLNRNIISVSFY